MRVYLMPLFLLLCACATTSGPINSPAYADLIRAALPGQTILVEGPGTWTPNSRRLIELQNTGAPSLSAAPWKDGVTAITERGLSFLEWDAQSGGYVVTQRLDRDNVGAVSLDVQGRSCALVVQEARNATFHVFEFTRGITNDCARARAALAALQGQS